MANIQKYFFALVVITSLYLCNFITQEKPVSSYPEEYLSTDEEEQIEQFFSAEKIRRIDSLMSLLGMKDSFNGSLLVSCNGNIIYNKVSGWADIKTKIPITDSSAFQLASVSKQFTAVSIAILKDRGKLEFDDDITEYINVPYSGITIRNLLNHTSGLPNYMWVTEHYWKNSMPPSNMEALELFSQVHPDVYFYPNKRFSYSNTNYFFLACIIEKISGLPYPDFIENNIFKPAGMNHSFVYSAAYPENRHNRVTGYNCSRHGFRDIDDTVNDGVTGDKGVYSTAEDLLKWDKALYSGLFLPDALLQETFTPVKLNNGKEQPYGFGFRLSKKDNNLLVYHNGLWNGFRTSFYRYTASKNTIIVFNNINSTINSRIVDEIEKIINDKQPGQYTRLLAQSTIHDGLTSAEKYYGKCKSMNPDLQINTESLLNLVVLLYQINKPILASQVRQLYNLVVSSDGKESYN